MSYGGSSYGGASYAGAGGGGPLGLIGDTAATVDSLSTLRALARPLSEAAATADTVHASRSRAIAEATATADTIARLDSRSRSLSEAAITTDSVVHGQASSLDDGAATTDALSIHDIRSRTITDSALSADTVARSVHRFRSLADNAATLDSLTTATQRRAISDTASTVDSLATANIRHRSLFDTAFTLDTLGSPSTLGASFTATVVVAPTLNASSRMPMPIPTPGSSGLHDYEVIVCDKYGVAFGKIQSAVVTEVQWVLDDIGEALIDFWILEPGVAELLPIASMPGAREIQVWRDQVLIWWGWPTNATFDAKQVHLTCAGLLFPFSKRNLGPITVNHISNPGFEQPSTGTLDDVSGWTAVNCTANVVRNGSGWPILVGEQAVVLGNPVAGANAYLSQTFPVTTGFLFFGVNISAWVYLIPNGGVVTPETVGQLGLYAEVDVGGVLQSSQTQQITAETSTDPTLGLFNSHWVRLETTAFVPPNTTATIEVRLYCPQGFAVWDQITMAEDEQVGSFLGPNDAQLIIEGLVNAAQNPQFAKSDLAIPFNGPPTGVDLVRDYHFSDNPGILDALNEYPTIAVCDFEVTWDDTGHFRQFQIYPPAKGRVKYNTPIEFDLGTLTDLQGSVDGTQVVTAARVLDQGASDSSQDIGFASFASKLGGRFVEDGIVTANDFTIFSPTINFTAADIGKAVYCLTGGAMPIGSFIDKVVDSQHAVIFNQGGTPPQLTVSPATIGIDGVIIDNVGSALNNLPITTITATAENTLQRNLSAPFIPTARIRADGPAGLFGMIDTGDVVPASMNYGWLTIDPQLMRIIRLTLFPITEELEVELNPQPIGESLYVD